MENNIILLITAAIVGLVIGFIIAKVLERNKASEVIKNANKTASGIIRDAKSEGETIKKSKILQAKEKFIELKSEHEKVILSRDKKMAETEKRIRDKESQVSNELSRNKKLNSGLDNKMDEVSRKESYLEKKTTELKKLHKSQVQQLEVISGLSAEDAKEQLVESLKEQAKTDAMGLIQDTIYKHHPENWYRRSCRELCICF